MRINIRLVYAVIPAALALTGCDITQPVAVIGPKGEIMRGSATAAMLGDGSFQVSRGNLRCAGTYDSLTMSESISFPVQCNNGLKGLGTAIRESGGQAGSGTIRMSDGSEWRFVFGRAAKAF